MRRVRAGKDQERVAVGVAARDRLGGEAAGDAGLGLDDDGLAEPLRHLVAEQPGDDVHVAARREAVHELDRAIGIVLRGGGAGESEKGGEGGEGSVGHSISSMGE